MRLTLHTSLSFVVLMTITLGLGACAAHKRDNATGVRAANFEKQQQKAQATTVTATDWKSILSTDNKGTYQLNSYDLKIVKNDESAKLLADTALGNSPDIADGKLPSPAVPAFIKLDKQADVKDSDIASILTKIPKTVEEFSAADGTILKMREDNLTLKDAKTEQYEETITISTGSGKVSDDTKWTAIQNIVKKLADGSIEVDRVAPLDSEKTMMTKEVMVYVLKSADPGTAEKVEAKK